MFSWHSVCMHLEILAAVSACVTSFQGVSLPPSLPPPLHRATNLGVPQQALGAHDDEGLAELAVHLAAQHVEVVGRRCAVDDLPVGALRLGAQVAAGEPLGVVDLFLEEGG